MDHDNCQLEVRRAFNGYCKKTLRNEAINAYKSIQRRKMREITFSDLGLDEENFPFFVNPIKHEDQDYKFVGRRISSEILASALNTLTRNLREIIELYYFLEFNDMKISRLTSIPRSTVQNQRSRALSKLRQYLEENADVWTDL